MSKYMMKYFILLLLLSFSGCNSFDAVDAASRTIEPLSKVIDYDTNGDYVRRTKPPQKVCEYRVSQYRIEWRPCK